MHKSGFINIIGQPNVGKSTLMNTLVGEKMSIITSKPQTTRHRIIGIVSGDDFQIIFSDTPGFVNDPRYKMHEAMNKFVQMTFKDADLMLFVTDPFENYAEDSYILSKLRHIEVPLFLVINKVDLVDKKKIADLINYWNVLVPNFKDTIPISALKGTNTEVLLNLIKDNLPEGPVFYPKDQLTDKPEKFFVSEMIREKILILYKQEIPYSCEVEVESFKETKTTKGEDLVRILANIYVTRKQQKSIIIGKDGAAIKKLGTMARKDIEEFVDSKVYLELYVRVKENWRNDEKTLNRFGY